MKRGSVRRFLSHPKNNSAIGHSRRPLFLITFSLFRPDICRDWFYPPFTLQPASEVTRAVGELPDGSNMRLRIEVSDKGQIDERTFILPVLKNVPPQKRLARVGLTT